MQRACGYAMQGSVCEKHFWVVYGNPDTSKSTFIAAIGNVFGGYHETADADTWLARHDIGGNRDDMIQLMGARLVTSSEFPANARWNESVVKKVTGNDQLTYSANTKNPSRLNQRLHFGAHVTTLQESTTTISECGHVHNDCLLITLSTKLNKTRIY